MIEGDEMARAPALVCGEIGLVRSLGEAGIPVYVGSFYDDNIALYSRYAHRWIRFSQYLHQSFVTELISFAKSLGRKPVFFTDDDRALLTLSRNREILSEYYHFSLPDQGTVEDVLDKGRFAVLARRHDLPIPCSYTPEGFDSLRELSNEIQYPCVLKPAYKEDWWHPEFQRVVGPYRKAIRCNTRQELLAYFMKVTQISKKAFIQEYVSGDDQRLYDLHALFDDDSNVVSYVLGRKIRTYPIHYGMGCYTVSVSEPAIAELGLSALQKIRFRGLANMNLKKDDRTGEVKILEINPRSSSWCYLDAFSGNNLALKAYQLATGQQVSRHCDYAIGVRWLNLKNDFGAFLQYRKVGEWSPLKWLGSFRGRTAYHVFSLRDPVPFVVSVFQFAVRRARALPDFFKKVIKAKPLFGHIKGIAELENQKMSSLQPRRTIQS
jgi:D-aspartate ligase